MAPAPPSLRTRGAATMADSGKLTVVIIEARGIKNTATLGTQDPFCSVQFCGRTVRTPTCDNGGTTPSTYPPAWASWVSAYA